MTDDADREIATRSWQAQQLANDGKNSAQCSGSVNGQPGSVESRSPNSVIEAASENITNASLDGDSQESEINSRNSISLAISEATAPSSQSSSNNSKDVSGIKGTSPVENRGADDGLLDWEELSDVKQNTAGESSVESSLDSGSTADLSDLEPLASEPFAGYPPSERGRETPERLKESKERNQRILRSKSAGEVLQIWTDSGSDFSAVNLSTSFHKIGQVRISWKHAQPSFKLQLLFWLELSLVLIALFLWKLCQVLRYMHILEQIESL